MSGSGLAPRNNCLLTLSQSVRMALLPLGCFSYCPCGLVQTQTVLQLGLVYNVCLSVYVRLRWCVTYFCHQLPLILHLHHMQSSLTYSTLMVVLENAVVLSYTQPILGVCIMHRTLHIFLVVLLRRYVVECIRVL